MHLPWCTTKKWAGSGAIRKVLHWQRQRIGQRILSWDPPLDGLAWTGLNAFSCNNQRVNQVIHFETWKKWKLHSDWSHSGTTASVRNAERFVQVQMGHVWTEVTWSTQGHLSVHVGAVHVNLASALMDHVTHFHHLILKHAVSGRISDHQAGQPILKLLSL